MSRVFAVLLVGLAAGACHAPGEAPPTAANDAVAHALIDSLVVDEARAADRYQRIVNRFGGVAPFVELAVAPRPRLDALLDVVARRGWVAPDPFAGQIGLEVYADVAGACDVAARFTQLMVNRYDRLLARTLDTDIRAVTRSNRAAAIGADLARTTACH
ncbi:MAG: hypothetical protein IPK85_21725 [Gemmatimonadetes bacterium]|nr:hypothetical protein [Gemmatimonadota bacterium]